jgi:hypothetical protein
MQYAATFGLSVWLRPRDPWLGKGVAASGALATRLGLSGVPVVSETVALHTLFELVRVTRVRLHVCRISSAAGVALVAAAKAEGLPVSCDVSINNLLLTDADIGYFDSACRVDPPFLPGPTYMLTGDLLLALAGTFPVAPQAVLDGWRGFEDKFLGMLVEQARVVRGLPVHVEGRGEHYLDAATPDKVRRPFCDAGWVTKLAVQVIGYNESLPLTQFQCPGWAWPLEDESYD